MFGLNELHADSLIVSSSSNACSTFCVRVLSVHFKHTSVSSARWRCLLPPGLCCCCCLAAWSSFVPRGAEGGCWWWVCVCVGWGGVSESLACAAERHRPGQRWQFSRCTIACSGSAICSCRLSSPLKALNFTQIGSRHGRQRANDPGDNDGLAWICDSF